MNRTILAVALALCAPRALAMTQELDEAEAAPRGLHAHEAGALEGYTLIAPLRSRSTFLVDMAGEVVHTWPSEHSPGGAVYLLDDGSILRACELLDNPSFRGGGVGGRIERMSWDGELLWELTFSDAQRMQHHDFQLLPNGNLLLIAWEYKTPAEAARAGRDPRQLDADGFWPDALFEIAPSAPAGGEVVWEWHAWDHLIQDFDPAQAGYGPIAEHPGRIDINANHRHAPPPDDEELERARELEEEMSDLGYAGDDGEDEERSRFPLHADWMHTNAVAYNPELDLIALSSPELNEVFIIDHSTTTEEAAGEAGGTHGRGGAILWRWGNPQNYGHGTRADRRLFYQHNPTWLPGPALLIFNNGGDRPEPAHSSVDELPLPLVDGVGFLKPKRRPFGPREPSWSYVAPEPEDFFSSFISGAQRLQGGNTLICSGAKGRVFEVTPLGEVVWDFHNPYGGERILRPGDDPDEEEFLHPNALFRATRHPPQHPGLSRLK